MSPSPSPSGHDLYPSDSNCTGDYYSHSLSELAGHSDHDEAFLHIYYLMLYVALIWVIGKLANKIGMPELVGQIVTGIIFGPYGINLVGDHGSEFLIVIGEIGLIMLVVEAGLDVDIGMLKLIGPRGLMVAVFGSMLPLLMGFVIATFFGQSIQSSMAIGACFAPTSMGIALNVLKAAKILNTPTGQLIIAAAVLDDVIALMLLSELQAMADPTIINILMPLIVSPVLILFFGYLSIKSVPRVVKALMKRIPHKYHENAILFLLFVSTFMLVPGCHYAGSSHLLGAFLAGLMFCTDHTVHHTWTHQVKRALNWMLKIFFACTIGFAIPINEFVSGSVIAKGCIYMICDIGKILTGVFAQPQKAKEFLTISFSMSAWGEFAFILATASYEAGQFDRETFSSVLLAVMLSVILSPYALRTTLTYYGKKELKKLDAQLKEFGNNGGHPVYYAIITKARGSWGHQSKLLKAIFAKKLEIIDFRSWHAPEYNHTHHKPLTKESFYVQDLELILPPTRYLINDQKKKLNDRVRSIKQEIRTILGDESSVVVKRWLPGLKKNDDHFDPRRRSMSDPRARRPSYCRRQAFKQAHSIMSMGNLKEALEEELKQEKELERKKSIQKLKMANHKPKHSSAKKGDKSDKNVGDHSGAGHSGQMAGIGALPIGSSIINIHSHLAGMDSTDESTSYIYADEDAEHHELPGYTDEKEYSKTTSKKKDNDDKKKDNDLVLPDDDYDYDGKPTETGKMLTNAIEMNKPNNNDDINIKKWNNDDGNESNASDLSQDDDYDKIVFKNDNSNNNKNNKDDSKDVEIVYEDDHEKDKLK